MKPQDVVDDYQSLSNLTSQMRAAAQDGEWDKLISLEQQSGQYVDRIQAAEETVALDDASRQLIAGLIRNILADDTEISKLTQSWMGQLQASLNSNRQEQRLNQVYGAG
ncbi:MAG: flagellar protein FliT [Nitrosomonadales bacterium]